MLNFLQFTGIYRNFTPVPKILFFIPVHWFIWFLWWKYRCRLYRLSSPSHFSRIHCQASRRNQNGSPTNWVSWKSPCDYWLMRFWYAEKSSRRKSVLSFSENHQQFCFGSYSSSYQQKVNQRKYVSAQ